MTKSLIAPAIAIFHREFDRFVKQKARCISAIVRPLLWLVVFAAGFRSVLGIAIQDQGRLEEEINAYKKAISIKLYKII